MTDLKIKKIIEPFCHRKECSRTCYVSLVKTHYVIQQTTLQNNCEKDFQILSSNDLINHEECIVKIQNANFIPVTIECSKSAVQTIVCLDSGACVNIISWKNLKQYFPTIRKEALAQENMLLSSANNSPIKCLGCIKLNIRIGNRVNCEKVYITTDKCNNILGLPGFKAFDMVINIKKKNLSSAA